MTGKHVLHIALLLPLMAGASLAQAHAAAGKRYVSAEQRAVRAQSFQRPGIASYADQAGPSCVYKYQGGPKSNLWTCRPEEPRGRLNGL